MELPAKPATESGAGRVFVGRRRELAELRAGWNDAVGGRGRFFLVVGEAGIGKTRLVEEVAHEATQHSCVTLWGRCWEGAGAPLYWPWVQVVRAYLRVVRDERPPIVLGVGAQYLGQLVPELAAWLPDAASVTGAVESEHARFHLFDALATFLKSAAERTPLVVVIDDLQWADPASLLFMHFLTRELLDARILLLGTYREVEVRETAAIVEALGALGREARHVPLRGFDEGEVREFIEATTGRSASAALAQAVRRDTEGNAFFVDEVLRLLVAERVLEHGAVAAPDKLPVPQGVRAAIRRRVAALPERCQEALAVASVCGRDFDLAVVERACDLHGEDLLETLAPAVTREIVIREPHGTGRYRFAHALIRETLYDEMPPAARARCVWWTGW